MEASGWSWSRDGLHVVGCIKRNVIARVCKWERKRREGKDVGVGTSLGSRKRHARGFGERCDCCFRGE